MINNAVADGGQLNTMAFDGVSFITGTFGLDTFLPPGKVGDYYSFQVRAGFSKAPPCLALACAALVQAA
jgi:hypothetical protein